jgi:hypothetical protein
VHTEIELSIAVGLLRSSHKHELYMSHSGLYSHVYSKSGRPSGARDGRRGSPGSAYRYQPQSPFFKCYTRHSNLRWGAS